ncbi:MAG: leucine-rich repeat domain-containing protein, partial [Clostridiales Family XIII bacterium]|nr:leucine-rich repeat domain-containing protein [Clostridiales Family XIII bacterium]
MSSAVYSSAAEAVTYEATAETDYVFDQDTKTIISYSGTSKAPIIPATIGGIPVENIGAQAFRGKGLLGVALPTGLKTIGEGAFQENSISELWFTSAGAPSGVTVPTNLTSIGAYAFAFNKLTAVTLPDTLSATGLGSFSFRGNKIETITAWPTTAGFQIGEGAFMDNTLESVPAFPSNVTGIGDSAFELNSIKTAVVPTSVTSYGNRVFADNGIYVTVTGGNTRVTSYSVDGGFGEIVDPATITAKFVDLSGATISSDQTLKTDLTKQQASTDAIIAKGKTVALDVPQLTGYKIQSVSTGTLSPDRAVDNLPALTSTTLTVTFTYAQTDGPPYFTAGTGSLQIAQNSYGGTMSAADLLADVTASDVDGNAMDGVSLDTAGSPAGSAITVTNVSPGGGTSINTSAVATYIVTYSVTDNHTPDLESNGTPGGAKTTTMQRVVVVGPDVRKGVVGLGSAGTEWLYEDFQFNGSTLIGFSSIGKTKFATRKDVVIPGINPGMDQAGNLDATKAGKVTTISGNTAATNSGQNFNSASTSMTSLLFSAQCDGVIAISASSFANYVGSGQTLDLSPLKNLSVIGDSAFSKFNGSQLVIENNTALTSIGASAFNAYVGTGQVLDLSALSKLKTIGASAFYNYIGTGQTLDLSGLAALETIDASAFYSFNGTELILGNLPKLKILEQGAFRNYVGTGQTLDLSGLTALERIGVPRGSNPSGYNNGVFQSFNGDNLIFGNLPNLLSIGSMAFNNYQGVGN